MRLTGNNPQDYKATDFQVEKCFVLYLFRFLKNLNQEPEGLNGKLRGIVQ